MKKNVQNKFNVPDGFFDQMEKDILAKTVDEQPQKAKVVPFYQKSIFKVAMSLAASIILIFGILQLFSNQNTATQETEFAEDILYDVYFDETSSDNFTLDSESIYSDYVP